MIKRLMSWAGAGVTYFCIATVLTQVVLLGVFWFKGALTPDKRIKLWAHLHGVDLLKLRDQERASAAAAEKSRRQAVTESPLLALRNEALDIGLSQVKNIETRISGERQRYDKIRDIFDSRLEELEQAKITASRATVQRTLEVVDTTLAKDLIIQILDEGGADDATAIMVRMPADRQKKIFSEFATPEEVKKMNQILMRLRNRPPDVGAEESSEP